MPDIAKIQAALDDATASVRARWKLPNLAGVLVRDGGSRVVTSVRGVRDITKSATASGNKMTNAQYFNVGSISKPITGLQIACLIKNGVLAWNTKIHDVFPEFRSAVFRRQHGLRDDFRNTRVFELLSHVSGVDGNFYYDAFDADGDRLCYADTDPPRSIAEQIQSDTHSRAREWRQDAAVRYMRYTYALHSMKKEPFRFGRSRDLGRDNRAGSGYGAAVIIVVAMIERLTGRSWESHFDELVGSDALDMPMRWGKPPGGVQMHRYNDDTGAYEVEPKWQNAQQPWGSKFPVGGVHCTVAGMARFIRRNLAGGRDPALFDQVEYQRPVAEFARGGMGRSDADPQHPYLGHNGWTGSSSAEVYAWPVEGVGVAVMTNSARGGDHTWAPHVELRSALVDIHHDWDSARFR